MKPVDLAGAPLTALDAAWADARRADTPDSRAAWLRAADALAATPGLPRLRAVAVYRALADDLTPTTDDDRARAEFMFRFAPTRDARIEALAARFAAKLAVTDGDFARYAGVVVAECAADRGAWDDAEARLTSALAVERGRTTVLEGRICSSLAQVYRAQGRDYEGLMLARRAVAVADVTGPDTARALAAFRVVDTLKTLCEWEACDVALERFEAALRRLPEGEGVVLRRRLAHHRTLQAVRRSDLAAARHALGDLDRLLALPDPDPADPRWFLALRAEVALNAGDLAEARRHLDACDAATTTEHLGRGRRRARGTVGRRRRPARRGARQRDPDPRGPRTRGPRVDGRRVHAAVHGVPRDAVRGPARRPGPRRPRVRRRRRGDDPAHPPGSTTRSAASPR